MERRWLVLFLLFVSLTFAAHDKVQDPARTRILCLAHAGDVKNALGAYRAYVQETGTDDYELLSSLSLALLQAGSREEDSETQLLACFGASISTHDQALRVLENGLRSNDPQVAVASMHFLAQSRSSYADDLIRESIRRAPPILQIEGIFLLAKKKHPDALGCLESLMTKLPPQARPILPIILAEMGSPSSDLFLKQLIYDKNPNVRLQTLLSLLEHQRDDFLPRMRRTAKQIDPPCQEVLARCFGAFKDESSIPTLENYLNTDSPFVRVAAAYSLYQLGQNSGLNTLYSAASSSYPFAITLLKDVPELKGLLYDLSKSGDSNTRLNANIALALQKDEKAGAGIREILVTSKNQLILRNQSVGHALSSFRWMGYAEAESRLPPAALVQSKLFRRKLLTEAIYLPEKEFLKLAGEIFDQGDQDLVPTLVRLLENLQSPEAIALLKKNYQKVGDPFVRAYCNLALFRMGEKGPFEENLIAWVQGRFHVEMVRFKEMAPFEMRFDDEHFELTPEEITELYVESIEALAKTKNANTTAVLIDALQYGNPKNALVLAGLIMRVVE